jgi:hypothetical protein
VSGSDDAKKKPPEPGDGTVHDLLGYLEKNPAPEARRLARTLLKDRFRMLQDEIELVRRRREASGPEERDEIDREIERLLGARITRDLDREENGDR